MANNLPVPIIPEEKNTQPSYQKKNPPPQLPDQNETSIRKNRIFVLDTNVLIHDERALFSFSGAVVGIPFVVLEELDKFKSDNSDRGRNARQAIRTLDQLRSKGHLNQGVFLEGYNSILKLYPSPRALDIPYFSESASCDSKDNLIIQTVSDLAKEGNHVTLITKDINARVKADALGLEAEDYVKGKVSYDEFYKGWISIPLSAGDLKSMTLRQVAGFITKYELTINEYIIFYIEENPAQYRLFRFLGDGNFKEVNNITIMHSFNARNVQQLMALDMLMDDSIQLVTLLGPAGTGKTFLALLVGLYKVAYEHTYQRLMVARPVIALGADIGFLPGDMQEKLHYWMQPVHDNLEFIYSQLVRGTEEHYNLGGKNKGEKREKKRFPFDPSDTRPVERLQQKGILSLEAITYMRGRSIPFQFVFIDEVQNLTPHEVKTIVSRAGEGTKVILAGDPYQIDSPYLDFTSNGLTVLTEKFKNNKIFGSVFMETSERSALAKLATELL